ncbi:MAG: hypothetical protein E5V54_24025 [Mesorhizobium sp.]|nr:MAG: hypothetical protein E5V54_24025 [Mesorhizobium sp.]
MNKLSADERAILDMFQYRRPRGSATEQKFIDTFLTPLGFKRDEYLNLYLIVGSAETIPTIMFSSHVDTVHRKDGIQTLNYDQKTGILTLSKRAIREGSNCLGADDTAGIWLMTEMIKAGVPGYYMIHHGEESGCIGSSDLAHHCPNFLREFGAAIAFDRQDYGDIITHQSPGRTCSDKFAQALADQLGGYAPSQWGVYTDTAQYSHLIAECTNVSVGYRGQHTSREQQDVPFLIELRNKLLAVDWAALPISRDPSEVEEDDDRLYSRSWKSAAKKSYDMRKRTLLDLCQEYPEVIADILENMGVDPADVQDYVDEAYGAKWQDDNRVPEWFCDGFEKDLAA